MSERSIYLRDQAAKCRRHASAMTDPYTRAELQKLAAEYIVRATEIESKEKAARESLVAAARYRVFLSSVLVGDGLDGHLAETSIEWTDLI